MSGGKGCRNVARIAEMLSRAGRAVVEQLEPRELLSRTIPAVDAPGSDPVGATIVSWNGQTGKARDGRWLVGLSDDFRSANARKPLAQTELAGALAQFGLGRASLEWVNDRPGAKWAVLDTGPAQQQAVNNWARALGKSISYIEPDWLGDVTALPGDADFSKEWGLNNTGQNINGVNGTNDADIDAPEAWGNSTGSGVIVAVIDTGVNWHHADLDANIWTNPGENPNDSTDNDNNGRVNDIRGWDFWDGDNDPNHGAGDTTGHGTGIAGVIAAENNGAGTGTGIVGTSYGAKILPLRAGYQGNVSSINVVSATDYATDLRANRGRNVRVINMSFTFDVSPAGLHDAIQRAGAAGITVVAAAGNGDSHNVGFDIDSTPVYPASYTDLGNLVSVAAIGNLDDRAGFSNFGSNSVDLGAPGIDVYTTKYDGTWEWTDGTSAAAPFTSAAAALLYSKVPDMTPAEMRTALRRNVVEISSLNGVTISGGRLNAANLLRNNWQMEAGADNSIARDSAGRMYVAYYDGAAHDLKFVSRGVDGVWAAPQTIYHDGSNRDTGHYPSLALKSTGQPVVAFYDSAEADLVYTELSAGSWTSPDRIQTVNSVGKYPSLKFDSSDHPAIAYYADTAQKLRFAEWTSSGWGVVDVQTGTGSDDVGRYPSLAINPNTGKKWAISYHDTFNGDLRFVERPAASTTWDASVRIDNGSGDRGWYSSLFFDGNDPYVSYYDGVNGDLYLTKRTSGAWALLPERVTGATTNSGLYSTLWKDGSTWNIVYLKKGATTADNQLYRAYGTPGGTWNFQLLESGGGNEARAVRTSTGEFAYTWVDAGSSDLLFSELINN